MANWPRDNQAELIKFYGDPGRGEVDRQLVRVVPPFKMYFNGRQLKSLGFHKKAAPALKAALNEIWEHYGRDQATLDRLGISNCAGTYNPRYVRGSKTKWSNHAYGAAIDLAAGENGFNAADADHDGHPGTIPQPVVQAFKRQGARWGGDYKRRRDPMHFEFCADPAVRTASLGAIDMPEIDNDDDAPDAGMDMTPPPHHDVAPDAPFESGQPWYKRAWTWLSTGGASLFAGGLYDWRVAVALGVVGLIIFLVVWFTYLRKKLEASNGI